MKAKISICLIVGVILSGCVDTQVMPMGENMVRINTQAGGLLFKGKAIPTTMRTAAKETLARGYSHFRFYDANLSQGSQFIGTIDSGQASCYGNSYSSSCYGSGGSTALHRHVESSEVTVVMFHPNQPGAKGAFDAQKILDQYPN